MATKANQNRWAPDGSEYVTLTDGLGNVTNQYPSGATPVTGMVTGTTTAVSAVLPAVAGKTTYLSGFTVMANATAATSIPNATVTGTVSGSLPFIEAVAALPAVGVTTQSFVPAIPASGVNTSISVNAGAAGAGGNTTIYAWGYQL